MNVWFVTTGSPLDSRTPGRRRPLGALTVLAAAGVLAAGCGTNKPGSGGHGGGGGAPTASGRSAAATVMVASTKLGQILVDGNGRTLYLFEKDRPNQSACNGACVTDWPVYHSAGSPRAGGGVQAAMLATIRRGDNTTQVTYNSHPLYYYVDDRKAGQLNGQDVNAFGAKWYVVAPTGGKVEGARP
jgi:predicted lipoprotein with Yx(FWY)xxD motif